MCARLVICPSLLSGRVTDSPWRGKRPFFFFFFFFPSSPSSPPACAGLLKGGLDVTTQRRREGGDTSERRRSGAGQLRRSREEEEPCGKRRVSHPSASWRKRAPTKPPYGCLRNNDTPPLPLFSLFLWDLFFFFFFGLVFFLILNIGGSWPQVACAQVLRTSRSRWLSVKKKKKKWIPSTLPWTSLAVMDTHIRWKVKRRIRDVQVTLAVILLFVTTQASSGKSAKRRKKRKKKYERLCCVCLELRKVFSSSS